MLTGAYKLNRVEELRHVLINTDEALEARRRIIRERLKKKAETRHSRSECVGEAWWCFGY